MEEPGCSMCLGMNDDQLNSGNGVQVPRIEILREGRGGEVVPIW